jgi:hypothetical protein
MPFWIHKLNLFNSKYFTPKNSQLSSTSYVLTLFFYPFLDLPKCDITVCPLRVIKPSGLTIRCNPLYKGPYSLNATISHPLGKLEGLVFTLSVSGQNNTGWYSCTVNNGIGESGTCWIYIDVLCKYLKTFI